MRYRSVEIRRHHSTSPWTYSDLDQKQRQIATQVRSGSSGVFLLSELAPVITCGRRTPSSDVFLNTMQIYSTDRGGLATYHGPGQWVLFPVDHLKNLTGDPRGVRKAAESLLEIALEVGRLYEPRSEIRWGREMGVWTPRGKFAAVGFHIEKGVLLHGLSVNGYRTPESFLGLRPCGLDSNVDFLLGDNRSSEFETLGQRLIGQALIQFEKTADFSRERLTGRGTEVISHSS
jgi:lipoyl(octanoyl) transferase